MTARTTTDNHYDAIIIGAGMSGLAAGVRLAMFDKRVVILEQHGKLGGLNSYYKKHGLEMDVGLHAVTNYAPKGVRRRPLNRLLRQLRLSHDELDLAEQVASEIRFPQGIIRFANGFESFRDGVLATFPSQRDAFDRFAAWVAERSTAALQTEGRDFVSARGVMHEAGLDAALVEMLLCPVQYYGSAWEHDIDFDQFVIMWEALFVEGLARPREGVRRVIRRLEDAYKSHGGELELKARVARLLREENGQQLQTPRVHGVELAGGQRLYADTVISTAGLVETQRLLCDDDNEGPESSDEAPLGRLSFVEAMALLDRPVRELGLDTAIVFFSTSERFQYRRPDALVDPTSGVICCPEHYRYEPPEPAPPPLVRVTTQANHERWRALDPDERRYKQNPAYTQAKQTVFEPIWQCAEQVLGVALRPYMLETDMFTPLTIQKFTKHPTGAVYGSPEKRRDGRTDYANLFLCGTDQGFLGITGAMLSGITVANLHVLGRG